MTTNLIVPLGRPLVGNLIKGLIETGLNIDPLFYVDYTSESIDALIAGGSKTGTITVDRGVVNPSTYIDSNGVMQLNSTSNTPRYSSKYYNSSGLQDFGKIGLLVEDEQKNYLIRSIFDTDGGLGIASGWAIATNDSGSINTSLVDIKSLFNVGINVNSQRMNGTFNGDGTYYQLISLNTAAGSFTQGDTATVSFFIKGSVSGVTVKIGAVEKDAGGSDLSSKLSADIASSLSSTEFRKFTYTFTCTEATCSRLSAQVYVSDLSNGDTIDIQVANAQIEKNAQATSFIPTTTVSLTRKAEVLKYETSGNRKVNGESCIIKCAPSYANGSSGGNRYLIASDTKDRSFKFDDTNDVDIFPNETDSSSCVVNDLVNDSWSAHASFTLGYNIKQESPYIAGYWDGVPDGTNETTDNFILNDWGTYFYVGCDSSGANQFNGFIFEIAFFNKILSDAQHLASNTTKLNELPPGGTDIFWNPGHLEGLELWLDASDETTITEVGGRISAFADKSVNGNDFTQGLIGFRPYKDLTTMKLTSIITGEGVNEYSLVGPSIGGATGYQNISLISICYPTTIKAGYLISKDGSGSNIGDASLISYTGGSGKFRFFDQYNSVTVDSIADISINIPHLVIGIMDQVNGYRLFIDGTLVNSDPTTGNTIWNNAAIDVQFGTAINGAISFIGNIGETVVVDRALSNSEITLLNQYVSTKWEVSI
jgi:hypothetical protein